MKMVYHIYHNVPYGDCDHNYYKIHSGNCHHEYHNAHSKGRKLCHCDDVFNLTCLNNLKKKYLVFVGSVV